MIRRFLLIVSALMLSCFAVAQTARNIKEDPSMIWAEGSGNTGSDADRAALDGLVRMLAATDIISVSPSVRLQIWQTYLPDIRRSSETVSSASGSVIRYIPWARINDIFESRLQKVKELYNYAEQAAARGKFSTARTYCGWAETYLLSLPSDQDALRERVAGLRRRLGEGESAAVNLRNIETEVQAIRHALSSADSRAETIPPRQPVVEVDEDTGTAVIERGTVPELAMGSRIYPDPMAIPPVSPPIRFRASTPPVTETEHAWQWSIITLADIGPTPSFGCMLVSSSRVIGGYVSMRSNFIMEKTAYSCQNDGTTDFGYIWTTGKAKGSRWVAGAGLTVRIATPLRLFAGSGYGSRSLLWEDDSSRWARVDDLSVRGITAECGLLYDFHRFTAAAGISSTGFRQCSVLLGCGYSF